MIDKEKARALVQRLLDDRADPHDQWIIKDDATMERPFGWVFFYNSARYLTEGDALHALAGNGPVFVRQDNGAVFWGGSLPAVEKQISDFEAFCIHDKQLRDLRVLRG